MVTPEIVQLTEGIQIIDDITGQPGVATLEGQIGPLIQGVGSRAHFIDMPAGLYVAEHPHPTESIIYTVRGRWVLCSAGQRHIMQPGSLFWFGPDVPTGYEVPFTEPAYILIFKGQVEGTVADFIDYLQNKMAPGLVRQQATGEQVFQLDALPADHPARQFAASLRVAGS